MNKVLTVLLVGLVFCFTAGVPMIQAEGLDPAIEEFSLTKDYSAPLIIPAVKFNPVMLQNVKAPEVQKKGAEAWPFIWVTTAFAMAFFCTSVGH